MERPKINPPLNLTDKFFEALAALALIYMIAQIIYEFPGLEDKIPTHFGAEGKPDNWGSKNTVLILPVIGIVLYVGMTLINFYPYIFNFPITLTESNAVKQYELAKSMITILKFTIIGMFLYIQIQTINVAQGTQTGLGGHFIFIVLIGTFLPIVLYFIAAMKNK